MGAGSGWNAGLMGHRVEPTGRMESVDIIPRLAQAAVRAIEGAGLPQVHIIAGDAALAAVSDCREFDRAIFKVQVFPSGEAAPPTAGQFVLRPPQHGLHLQRLTKLERWAWQDEGVASHPVEIHPSAEYSDLAPQTTSGSQAHPAQEFTAHPAC
ncbi:hypothetical protein [Hyalangium sp.]|uniref:hypothetical protein n=1 Tax=Hyalangium sp. TaxID=2028555 RepID=UPI0039C88A94